MEKRDRPQRGGERRPPMVLNAWPLASFRDVVVGVLAFVNVDVVVLVIIVELVVVVVGLEPLFVVLMPLSNIVPLEPEPLVELVVVVVLLGLLAVVLMSLTVVEPSPELESPVALEVALLVIVLMPLLVVTPPVLVQASGSQWPLGTLYRPIRG